MSNLNQIIKLLSEVTELREKIHVWEQAEVDIIEVLEWVKAHACLTQGSNEFVPKEKSSRALLRLQQMNPKFPEVFATASSMTVKDDFGKLLHREYGVWMEGDSFYQLMDHREKLRDITRVSTIADACGFYVLPRKNGWKADCFNPKYRSVIFDLGTNIESEHVFTTGFAALKFIVDLAIKRGLVDEVDVPQKP